MVVFPTHLNPNNFLFYITSNFTPIHVYPRLKMVFVCCFSNFTFGIGGFHLKKLKIVQYDF